MMPTGRSADQPLRRARAWELAVALIIMAILLGVVLSRLSDYQRQMRVGVAMQQVSIMRTALALKVNQLRLQGRTGEIYSLAGANPIRLLDLKLDNYLGELTMPDQKTLPSGAWYYEKTTKTLVYVLNQRKSFPQSTPNRLKFQVKLLSTTAQYSQSSSRGGHVNLVLDHVDG